MLTPDASPLMLPGDIMGEKYSGNLRACGVDVLLISEKRNPEVTLLMLLGGVMAETFPKYSPECIIGDMLLSEM
jgi:hypothetical protein